MNRAIYDQLYRLGLTANYSGFFHTAYAVRLVIDNPQRLLLVKMCIRDSYRAVRFPGQDKIHLRLHIRQAMHGILLSGRLQFRQAILRVMETRNGLIKRLGWIILQHSLETAEPVSYTHLDVYKRQQPSIHSAMSVPFRQVNQIH